MHLPPGELCGMILGDLGADIIKVEPASQGKFIGRQDVGNADMLKASAAHDALNRNKQSIKVNLKSEDGRKIFYKLVEDADVIIEGFRPGVAKRMSVDYSTVRKINPGSCIAR